MCRPPGCYCQAGYVRDANGECVSNSTCSPTIHTPVDISNDTAVSCKPNEHYTTCGSCEATCDTLNAPCIAMCQPAGCYCGAGFVRDANGDCVSVSTCSATANPPFDLSNDTAPAICRPNEHYTECGGCEATCDNQNPICTMMCRPAGCYCGTGFVRNANGDSSTRVCHQHVGPMNSTPNAAAVNPNAANLP
uniref:TIL domain-containing protein n=1 Tax=Panagrellus redivivus TaxID=6233 RepID=A0A7E4W3N8_PANRE